jgi:putative SOS response-associated peptidase YedK
LIPTGPKGAKIAFSAINAMAETVATKASGCLVPADGFYEWKKLDAKAKQPGKAALIGRLRSRVC